MLAASALIGCGGDATVGPNPGTPVIPANGGVPQNNGSSNESRAAAANPQQVQVTVGGSARTAFLPAGVPITAGQQVAVFASNQVILQGFAPTIARTAGDIKVKPAGASDFFSTGVHLRSDGTLSDYFVLPNGEWEVLIEGPLRISQNGNTLDIASLSLRGFVNNGFASIPVGIDGQLPINGGSSSPLRLDIQMPPEFNNGFVSLRITHSNGILDQQKTLSNGHAQFHDLIATGSSQIPVTGVLTVEFRYFLLGG